MAGASTHTWTIRFLLASSPSVVKDNVMVGMSILDA